MRQNQRRREKKRNRRRDRNVESTEMGHNRQGDDRLDEECVPDIEDQGWDDNNPHAQEAQN